MTPWTVAPPVACPQNSPGKNTGAGFHSLLQEIFLTQGSNLSLLHWRQTLWHLSHQGRPLFHMALNKSKIYSILSLFHQILKWWVHCWWIRTVFVTQLRIYFFFFSTAYFYNWNIFSTRKWKIRETSQIEYDHPMTAMKRLLIKKIVILKAITWIWWNVVAFLFLRDIFPVFGGCTWATSWTPFGRVLWNDRWKIHFLKRKEQ